jgi:hypothetical protein
VRRVGCFECRMARCLLLRFMRGVAAAGHEAQHPASRGDPIGAAYGVLTLIIRSGHLQGALGFSSYGAIVPWLPLLLFVILFRLSMDCYVFILSRIRALRAPELITAPEPGRWAG